MGAPFAMTTTTSVKKLSAALLLWPALWAAPATGAEVEFHKGDDGIDVIMISGEIKPGDDEKFKKLALNSKSALVVLESDGGALVPALEIGRAIQLRSFSTFVPDNAICASACALTWIAGTTRFVGPSGLVGFHASYRDSNGRLEEVGVANAMVGRYLTLMNLPESAVIFATATSPQDIIWLTTSNASRSGISYQILDLDNEPEEDEGNEGPWSAYETSEQAQEAPLPKWYYAVEDKDGSKYYVRGQDVELGRSDSRAARMWVQSDDSTNSAVSYRSSKALYVVDCIAETYTTETYIEYDKRGNPEESPVDRRKEHIVPGSIFADIAGLVCSNDRPSEDERDIM